MLELLLLGVHWNVCGLRLLSLPLLLLLLLLLVLSHTGKWFVRKGQRIEINNVALQRREDQWGGRFGDPNKYNPDRFLPGAAEETGRHPNAFK